MAVDAKTTGAGVVTLLLSGGTSYAISSNLTKDSSEEASQGQKRTINPEIKGKVTVLERKNKPKQVIQENEADKGKWIVVHPKGKIKKIFEESKLSLLNWDQENEETLKIIKEKYSSDLTKESLKTYCESQENEDYVESKYTDFVKKCAASITFADRAKGLSIQMTQESSEEWDVVWRRNKEKLEENILKESSSGVTFEDNQEVAKKYCVEEGKITWSKIKENSKLEDEWRNYISVCAAENGKEWINFWTGKMYVYKKIGS